MELKKNQNFIEDIKPMFEALQSLMEQSLNYYEPIINNIIQNKIENRNEIERIFEGLLDIAYDDRALVLYKKLARYYYNINEEATFYYINEYRELWDSNDDE